MYMYAMYYYESTILYTIIKYHIFRKWNKSNNEPGSDS